MRKSRRISVGGVEIGGGAPVSVQSMTKTDTRDVEGAAAQVSRLEAAGCEIVRAAVPDMDAARSIAGIKKRINIPLVADIHFDYRLALESLNQGADGLRLNPGNIGARWKVEQVVKAAAERGAPIRIGVNAGSLGRDMLAKYGGPTAEAMVESAMGHVRILEDLGFREIKISLKASSVPVTVAAYKALADVVDYPFHVGVSEAGTPWTGAIKSAVGIGALLMDGIGDTIRVSLTGDPVEEVKAAYEILKASGVRRVGPELISCPTCGRLKIDLFRLAAEVEAELARLDKPLKVAVMGCVVNGPGEAREADIGLAGGDGVGLIFRKGEIVRKVKEDELAEALMEEARRL
ncbi:MAG: flavodoxin-dependent (E)-4-hydroxy-3-methylbut-2-enyl-diphosphate synthase [Candidatus Nitrospinota bacterium M3_3B_026]